MISIMCWAESGIADESIPRLQRGNENILFVDDEQLLVEMASDMLTTLGYTVTGFTDSIKALGHL